MICDILFITVIIFGMIFQILIKVIIQTVIPNTNFVVLASNIVIEVAIMAVINTFMSIVNNIITAVQSIVIALNVVHIINTHSHNRSADCIIILKLRNLDSLSQNYPFKENIARFYLKNTVLF